MNIEGAKTHKIMPILKLVSVFFDEGNAKNQLMMDIAPTEEIGLSIAKSSDADVLAEIDRKYSGKR